MRNPSALTLRSLQEGGVARGFAGGHRGKSSFDIPNQGVVAQPCADIALIAMRMSSPGLKNRGGFADLVDGPLDLQAFGGSHLAAAAALCLAS